MRSSVIVFAMFFAGCQLFLPEFEIVDGGGGTDSNSNLAANGDACTDEFQCQSGHCLNGVCCQPGGDCCNGTMMNCPDSYACNLDMFECYTECAPGGEEHDEYCVDGFHCDGSNCLDDIVTGDCDEGSDCVSDECISDYCCEHAGLCCGGDQDCPEMFDGCSVNNTQTCVFSPFLFPDTGQADECYDPSGTPVNCSTISPGTDYYGQDGHYPGPGRLYDDSNTDWIVDQITGLSWTVGPLSQDGWDNAVVICGQETAGSKTWRLPKRHELLSIVDYHSGGGVGADPVFGFSFDTDLVWSVESSGDNATKAWAVDFDTGDLLRVAKIDTGPRYICVAEN